MFLNYQLVPLLIYRLMFNIYVFYKANATKSACICSQSKICAPHAYTWVGDLQPKILTWVRAWIDVLVLIKVRNIWPSVVLIIFLICIYLIATNCRLFFKAPC